MGDHKLPKGVISGELENTEKRGPRGEGERMDGLRVAGIPGFLVSWGTGALPHLTQGFGTAQYAIGAVGL